MKKFLFVLLTAIMITTLFASCKKETSTTDAPKATETPEETEPAITTPTDAPENVLTFTQAKEVAKQYWELTEDTETTEDGTIITILGFEDDFVIKDDIKYYRFDLKWLVTDENGEGSHYSVIDTVYVNTKTSECTYEKP